MTPIDADAASDSATMRLRRARSGVDSVRNSRLNSVAFFTHEDNALLMRGAAEAAQQKEVVDDLQSAGGDERHPVARAAYERHRENRRERRAGRARDAGDSRGGCPLLGIDDGDYIRLSGRNIHLRDRKAQE